MLNMSREIIGIVGTIAAGKDVAGEYIGQSLNLPVYQISSPLKAICKSESIEPTRDNLIVLGTKLAAERGDGYLAQYILESSSESLIITGMRQLGQLAVLDSRSDLTLLSIDASPELRFERAMKSGKSGEATTLDEFVARELAENSPPNAQRLFECMKLAQYHLTNEGPEEEFRIKLDQLINVMGK